MNAQSDKKESFRDYFVQQIGKLMPLDVKGKDIEKKSEICLVAGLELCSSSTPHAFHYSTRKIQSISI